MPYKMLAGPEYPQQLVTELDHIVAVWEGEIRGDYYDSDQETYANIGDLIAWIAKKKPLLAAPELEPDHYV